VTPAASLSDYLQTRRARIEQALAQFLPDPPGCPIPLSTAMRYSLLGGGKRLRPILALAAAETVADVVPTERALDLALPVACAIEFIHTYSLIHDDLPAMDDDSLRRGRPTNHVVHGDGMAILAGDGLLTEAFALMAREPADATLASRKLRAMSVVAIAAGATGMVGGQALDLDAVGSARGFDIAALQDMHARKTGALIRASAAAGAIMAGAGDEIVRAVEEYGTHLGLAFQIVDDILDVEGQDGELGKTAGKDAKAGKPTYPALHGIDASRTLAAEHVDRALAALSRAQVQPGRLGDIAAWVITRTN
jgi:geranylgeranyl diphosphate synthase, type II